MEKYLHRLAEWSGWILSIVLILEFISGYGVFHFRIFGTIISKPAAFKLHRVIQPVAAFFILTHILPYLRRGLAKISLRGRLIDFSLIVLALGAFVGTIYLYLIG